jgi:mRNA-degrading endonuclease RelE of RelBE toxin-antitoxin system
VPYTVELSPAAARQLKKLPENICAAVARRIDLFFRKEDLSFLRKLLEDRR